MSTLNADSYLRVERPPQLWEADAGDVALLRVLGEMIAVALTRGTALGEIVCESGGSVTVLLRRAAKGRPELP